MCNPANNEDRDAGLVNECLQGSEKAWNEFHRRYDGFIRVVVRRNCRLVPEHAEDDLVQNVYLRLVRSLQTYDPQQSQIKAFIGLVAKRTCIDYLRKSTSSIRYAQTSPVDHHGDGEEGTVNPTSRFDGPDEHVDKAQQLSIVGFALRRLKAACRELIRLRYHLDMPYGKIAQMVGKKEHTVNVQVIRCLAELKANYDEIVREGLRP